ncbi:hypothetical protein MUB23_03630 [Cuneatibacter sp. NSJ-177]|uniref:hypothetical protein n=1 Tax=Cuneatibacter sp. NSJ-177 TaxID=2931401 RepID=UPI001FD50E74|nr:hypothetical protein [Cuneatibacter sp. NSJ-177]MCJ7834488.1 hypothetical protein [Cuneatibacter sp. NSJ-177]
MENEARGRYGYIDAHRKSQLLKAVICGAIVLLLLILGVLIWGSKKNWLMIPAMLMVIPTANFFVAFAAFAKFHTAPKEKYELLGNFENQDMLLSDLILVDEKGRRMPVEFAVVYKNGVVAFSSVCGKRFRSEDAEIPVNDVLKRRGIPMRMKLYSNWDEFLERIDKVEMAGDESEKKRIDLAKEAVISTSM